MRKPVKEPIAIVGMGCRYPGAPDLPSFWQVLKDGRDALSMPVGRRFREQVSGLFDLQPEGLGGLLEDIDCFDAEFFGMSPHEASCLDPQQRLLLEVAWQAFEDAGLTQDGVAGARAGVFAGVWAGDFENTLYANGGDLDVHLITGVGRFPGPNRISYALDLRGPSMMVDTACSSSLVAVHLACQSIWSGESEFAIAGGVNAILRPEITEGFIRANMLAPDRRCKFGDASANGFVRSEGAGMVVLKPLSNALEDGDRIYATIRGTAVNNDGQSNGMLLHPSREGQEQLLRDACNDAGVTPSEVQYVEAHGTGTAAGDPVEIEALGNVFGAAERNRPCLVGSVKTNIGHTEGAAGVAGLLKVALSLWHGAIPASLHFHEPNPKVPWRRFSLEVPTCAAAWPANGGLAIAGVSAFGLTGTNAHVVLEGAAPESSRPRPQTAGAAKTYLLPLSAKRSESLDSLAQSYARQLQADEGLAPEIADLVYTAALRRTHHAERLALVAADHGELAEKLDGFLRREPRPGTVWGQTNAAGLNKIAFVFPGQGAQWTGMGRQLFQEEPVFRQEIERCHAVMQPLVSWSLLGLFTCSEPLPERIDIIQPALFAVSAALSKLWFHWGVTPDAVVGHSMGEVAAAYTAGALSLTDAATVICRRSALMRRVEGQGSMALVELPEDVLRQRLAPYGGLLSVAASNSASSTVLSGETAAMQHLLSELERRQTFCRFIKVDVASHSAYVDPIREELLGAIEGIKPGQGSIPMYSTVTGDAEWGPRLNHQYWVRNLREPVMFGRAIQQLIRDGFGTFLELSPHPLLTPSVQAGLAEAGRNGLATASLKRDEDERSAMLASAACLYVAGHHLDWKGINGSGFCVSLPVYPFHREHAWPEALSNPNPNRQSGKEHPFLKQRVESSVDQGAWLWDMEIGTASMPYLADHRVRGLVVFPGAGYLEIALSAARQGGVGSFVLEGVEFTNALVLPDGATRHVQLSFSPATDGARAFRFSVREQDASWTVLASGNARALESQVPAAESPEAIRQRCSDGVSGEEHYRRLTERGLQYGPAFQLVDQAWFSGSESLVSIRVEANKPESGRFQLYPPLLDAGLQAIAGLFPQSDPLSAEETYVPVSVERVRIVRTPTPGERLYSYAMRKEDALGALRADLALFDSAGDCVLEATGFVCRSLDLPVSGNECLYELSWKADTDWRDSASKPGSRNWLLFADRKGIATQIASALRSLGHRCVLAYPGPAYGPAESGYRLNAGAAEDYRRLLNDAGACDAVLHLWSLDLDSAEDMPASRLDDAQHLSTRSILLLTRALADSGWSQPPRLWLTTAGLHDMGTTGRVSFANAPTWGLGRVVACEHPELQCASVDLSPAPTDHEIEGLARTLCSETREDQIVLRGDARFFARYKSLASPEARPYPIQAGTSPYRVVIGESGNLNSIGLEPARRMAPGAGEVEIEIVAAGLNFIDVLKSLGIYPGLEPGSCPPLGGECAGIVVRTGRGVSHVKRGHAVIAITPSMMKTGLLASHAVVPAELVFPKPTNLTWDQAATTPLAFLTAWYGLHTLAGMRSGERILIHAGTGGVGLAAIQLAQRAGAAVFATAGSPEKRRFLHELGVEHVFDSRSASFATEVLKATASAGVDIVLNSLSGDLLTASLSTLGRYGRFIEIGKRDIYEDRPLGMAPFRRSLSFFAVDLAAMLEERRDEVATLLQRVLAELQAGSLQPLPVNTFPASKVSDMFHHVASAQHIGKVALTFSEPEVVVRPVRPGQMDFRTDAGYLITGGLGGIGLEVAQWMVDRGARFLVLAGRSKPSGHATAAIIKMQAKGAVVRTVSADASIPEEVKQLLQCFGDSLPPLKGILHAAAVVDDELIVKLDPARLPAVMAPKALGAWNLHQQTTGMELDFFVLFSSIASVLPQPGHASYAAANAFLDALARHRRSLGLPGLSINWGGWSGTGLALTSGASGSIRGYASRGMKPMPPRQALDALSHLLGRDVSGALVVPVDWRRVATSYAAEGVPPVLSDLVQEHLQAVPRETRTDDPVTELRRAPREQRRELLESHLRTELSRVLRLAPSRIERDKRLGAMGLDSLMAVAFVRRLSSSLGVLLPATAAFNYPTIAALAGHAAEKLGLELEPKTKTRSAQPAHRLAQPEVSLPLEDLSEEQAIQALLLKRVRG